MSKSFIDAVNWLQDRLLTDAGLKAYCQTTWGKAPMVLKTFKKRVEIDIRDLPVILITRPDVRKTFVFGGPRDGVHSVRLYCGFLENDRLKALDEIVQIEEKIDDSLLSLDALVVAAAATAGITNINPKTSINDEGMYHPSYFIAMDVEITHRRF